MEENLYKIINRIKQLEGLHTETQVAKVLGMSRENLNNYKRRHSIPRKAIERFCLQQGISLNYVLYGIEPPRIEEAARPASAEDDLSNDKIRHLMKAAVRILTSGNKHAVEALGNCIEYLNMALDNEKKYSTLEEKVRKLEQSLSGGPHESGPEDGSDAPGPSHTPKKFTM